MRQRRTPHADAGSGAAAKTPASAKVVAVRWLARREWSRAELAQRLRQRGYAEDELNKALDDLAAAGYLSDARFARAVVAQKTGRYAKRAIAYALKERGVGADDAAIALAPITAEHDFTDAQTLWQRRFGQAPVDDREKARQIRFLMARGYAVSVALRILRTAGAQADDEP